MQYLPLNTNSVCFLTLERTARRYAHDMGVWLKLREMIPTPWLQVRYEDSVADLEKEARRVLDVQTPGRQTTPGGDVPDADPRRHGVALAVPVAAVFAVGCYPGAAAADVAAIRRYPARRVRDV
jgi:hypothetical protein